MKGENRNLAANLSNLFAVISGFATFNTVARVIFSRPSNLELSIWLVLIVLLASYLLSRKIPGCVVPLRRILYISTFFSGAFLFGFTPLAVLIDWNFNHKTWFLVGQCMSIGILFLLASRLVYVSVKNLESEKKDE